MDPFIVAALCTFMGGFVIRATEEYLGRNKRAIAISAPTPNAGENYDLRWQDPDYVEMIHKTIAIEKETLDEAKTVCECSACINPPSGCGFMGCGKAGCEDGCSPNAIARPGHTRYISGYQFNLPDYVPDSAFGRYDLKTQTGTFRWTDKDTGQTKMIKAIPTMDLEPGDGGYVVWTEESAKPIRQVQPRKFYLCSIGDCGDVAHGKGIDMCLPHHRASKQIKADAVGTRITANKITGGSIKTSSDHSTHVIFTSKGMQHVTKKELKHYLDNVRENDRKRRDQNPVWK